LWLLAGAFLGLLAADAAGGVAHWFCDSFFAEETPILGPLFIEPFREHHEDPGAMTRHGFLELNGNSALALCPVAAVALLAWPADRAGAWALFCGGAVVAFCLAGFATNQFHCWAHRVESPRRMVRWLQRQGLILSPEAHARHHAPPHDRAYCVTTGWLNGPLDRLGFFRAGERVLRSVGVPLARTTVR
jgi:ubiquitin-conjugating enzyme E2 variant